MTSRKQAGPLLQKVPLSTVTDDPEYTRIVREKIQAGVESMKAGRVIPHEEMKRRVEKWKRG